MSNPFEKFSPSSVIKNLIHDQLHGHPEVATALGDLDNGLQETSSVLKQVTPADYELLLNAANEVLKGKFSASQVQAVANELAQSPSLVDKLDAAVKTAKAEAAAAAK